MNGNPAIVLALSPQAEGSIESLLFGAQAAVRVAATVDELTALDRVLAGAGEADALLISADLPGLTRAGLAAARSHGLRLIGIATSDRDADSLRELGLDAVLVPPIDAAALRTAARASTSAGNGSSERSLRAVAAVKRGGSGAVLAVVGSRRSPGASELACSLAAQASERWQAILVEFDLLGGGLAFRLGADPAQGSILGLLRATAEGTDARRDLVERWLVHAAGWPRVLPAPREPSVALEELARPGATGSALEALAALYPLVVADVGFLLAGAGEIGPVVRCHREALVTADAVLLVVGAREAQLDAGLAQLDLLLDELGVPPERLRIVSNGVGGPGTIPRPQLEQTLTAGLLERQLSTDALVPWDGRALAKATRTGTALATARPRGPYAHASRRLLDTLFLPAVPVTRGRKHLLPQPTKNADVGEHPQAREEEVEVALPWRS